MTLLEVVMAIMIFFFVLTAIFGLLGATTNMSVFSKERTLLVNAMNSYIEDVRSMQYLSVGMDVSGAQVPGDLPGEVVRTVGGYQIVLRPTVTWVDDPDILDSTTDYKQLTVDGDIMRGGEAVYTLSMSTFIRREGPPGVYTPPTLEFGPGSPLDVNPPAVVSGRSVLIDATAAATMPGTRITILSFTASPAGSYLRSQSGAAAHWSLNERTVTRQFYWDTLAVDEDGRPFVTDGEYTITIEAGDSNQKRVSRTRRVTVDNYPPNAPTDLVANALLSGTQVPLTWTPTLDGRTETPSYRLEVQRQGAAGAWTGLTLSTGSPLGTHTLTTVPFARYSPRIAAEGARGMLSTWFPTTAAPPYEPVVFVTRPLVSGTYRAQHQSSGPSGRGWYVRVILTTTTPSFPVHSVRYELRERTPTGSWSSSAVQSSTNGAFDYTYFVAANNKNQGNIDRLFQVRAFYRLAVSGPELMLQSNTLGPTSKVGEPSTITFPSPGTW
jgi:type II secretory pathway pseudopilin PulG